MLQNISKCNLKEVCLRDLKYKYIFSDVHWVWHVHMLSPVSYKRDLERVFGRVLNHSPKSKGLDDLTHAMWNKMWPDEPFEPNESSLDTTYKSQFDYDIISAVQRQRLFFYQVSLPHYKDLTFLQEGLQRYKMYLFLKSVYFFRINYDKLQWSTASKITKI